MERQQLLEYGFEYLKQQIPEYVALREEMATLEGRKKACDVSIAAIEKELDRRGVDMTALRTARG